MSGIGGNAHPITYAFFVACSGRTITDRLCGLVVRVSGYRYRGPGFDPRRYQIFWVVVGLERGPLSSWASWGQLRSYLNEKSSGSRSRKQRLTAVGTRCADHVTPLYPQKLALTSPTGGGRSVGIVRVRTKATECTVCTVYSPYWDSLLYTTASLTILPRWRLQSSWFLGNSHLSFIMERLMVIIVNTKSSDGE